MGHAMVSGGARASAPVTGIKAGDLAVGSSVYLMENGVAVEYLVVNQGIPSDSSLYDDSCDGTWLLRKDSSGTIAWNSSNYNNSYSASTSNAYLNNDFYSLFGDAEKAVIKQVKIPYRAGSGISSTVTGGESGLSVKVFYLSFTEVGFTSSNASFYNYAPKEGARLEYFSDAESRKALLSGAYSSWNLRSPYLYQGSSSLLTRLLVGGDGTDVHSANNKTYGNRPAIIITSDALFDKNTRIIKGVS